MSTSRDHIVSLSIVERYLKRFFELMRHPKSALGDHSLDKESVVHGLDVKIVLLV